MPLRYSVENGVATIVLDRPDVLNAFDDVLGKEVLTAMVEGSGDPSVRCIVVTGAGRAFSAGEDLGALSATYQTGEVPELGRTLVERYNPLIRAIRTAPKPVVAAVNGVAAGAGASIALACDYRIASEHAKLVLAFVKVALVPDSGALWFLARMVGTARAWEIAAGGAPVDADQGLSLGLFTKVVAAADFESEYTTFARELAAGPTRAYALTKHLLDTALEVGLDAQLDAEVDAQTEAGRTQDHREGVTAFFARRKPDFSGE